MRACDAHAIEDDVVNAGDQPAAEWHDRDHIGAPEGKTNYPKGRLVRFLCATQKHQAQMDQAAADEHADRHQDRRQNKTEDQSDSRAEHSGKRAVAISHDPPHRVERQPNQSGNDDPKRAADGCVNCRLDQVALPLHQGERLGWFG